LRRAGHHQDRRGHRLCLPRTSLVVSSQWRGLSGY
jgi:hypothetical protein